MKLRHVWYLIAGTIAAWLIYGRVIDHFFASWAEAGTFGDSFGALNTLFTGLAFVVVLASLLQQARQVEQARVDIAHEQELNRQTADFVRLQAQALSNVARLTALTARIETYSRQIDENRGSAIVARLIEERTSLLHALDEVLRRQGD